MNKLDFLSGSPNTLIFEKNSNKTNFGGVLTMIYLIILLIIIITYMVDYAVNPKYSFMYTYEHQFKTDNESINNRYNNKDLNPKITFNLKMASGINESHFQIISSEGLLEFGKDYTGNLYDLSLFIFYKCNNTNYTSEGKCELHDDEEKRNNESFNAYNIIFNYTGDKVDHQNPDSPLKKTYLQKSFIFSINDKITVHFLGWKTIKYTEERGILGLFDSWFDISNEVFGGEFIDPLVYNFEIYGGLKELENNVGMKILDLILMNERDPHNYIDSYSRIKKGIFDPIANICSLALTIYNGFVFIFCGYYSNNFDNYKIVEKILSKNGKPYKNDKINERDDKSEISDDLDKKDALLDSNISNSEENIIENDKEKEVNINDNFDEQKEYKTHSELCFYDFLFNNFYLKKCCNSNKQNFVSACNEIVSRYNSVDYIIFNQIKLENLFKDYKWNNPRLKYIQNNKLIKDLNLFG